MSEWQTPNTFDQVRKRMGVSSHAASAVWVFTRWYANIRQTYDADGYIAAQKRLVDMPLEDFQGLYARYLIEEE